MRSVTFKTNKMTFVLALLLAALCTGNFCGCDRDESSILASDVFFGPLSMALVPGTDVLLVASSNFDFSNSSEDPQVDGGTLIAVDTVALEIDSASSVTISNFAGQIAIDPIKKLVFVANRYIDHVDIFRFDTTTNSVIDITFDSRRRVGKDPFGLLLTDPAGSDFTKLYSLNIETEDLSLINAHTRLVVDLDVEDDSSETLDLRNVALGSTNISKRRVVPNRFIPLGRDDLYFISTNRSGVLLVFDTKSDQIKAGLDFSPLDIEPEFTGGVVVGDYGYFASNGTQSIYVIDVSEISDNGIFIESIEPSVVDVISIGRDMEDVEVRGDGAFIFVAGFGSNTVIVIDPVNLEIVSEIEVGLGPAEMVIDDANDRLYVSNFFSNSISVINTQTFQVEATIE